ncbi:MAG: hypothetical protein ACTSVC_15885 [Promethearchaeota archaeon]
MNFMNFIEKDIRDNKKIRSEYYHTKLLFLNNVLKSNKYIWNVLIIALIIIFIEFIVNIFLGYSKFFFSTDYGGFYFLIFWLLLYTLNLSVMNLFLIRVFLKTIESSGILKKHPEFAKFNDNANKRIRIIVYLTLVFFADVPFFTSYGKVDLPPSILIMILLQNLFISLIAMDYVVILIHTVNFPNKFANYPDFEINIFHPDKCAGLKDMGNLTYSISLSFINIFIFRFIGAFMDFFIFEKKGFTAFKEWYSSPFTFISIIFQVFFVILIIVLPLLNIRKQISKIKSKELVKLSETLNNYIAAKNDIKWFEASSLLNIIKRIEEVNELPINKEIFKKIIISIGSFILTQFFPSIFSFL